MDLSDYESEAMDMSDGDMQQEQGVYTVTSQHKRKLSDTDNTAVAKKKVKIVQEKQAKFGHLTDAVWQRVMLQLPPAMLLRLRRVCRKFQYLLTDAKAPPVPRKPGKALAQIIDSEAIWIYARRQIYPNLPRPLAGLTEAQMLVMLTKQSCMKCGRRGQPAQAFGPFNNGPGAHGVRPIWQFRVTVCGPCLCEISVSEIDFLKERHGLSPGVVRMALSSIFLTRDMNVVSESTARNNGGQGIVKLFSRQNIQEVLAEYGEATTLGDGAADEWKKGLDDMGKAAVNDVSRWTRFEDALPPGTSLPQYMRDDETFAVQQPKVGTQHLLDNSVQHRALPSHTHFQLPQPVQAAPPSQQPYASGYYPSHDHQSVRRQARDPQEAEEALRQRRQDIHKRCAQLPSPLEPDVLQYMNSYQAAMLIKRPLSEDEWAALLPRLEAERETAQNKHYERSQQMAALRAAIPQPSIGHQHQQWQNRDIDRSWIAAREPLRKKLAEYADDIINAKWLRATAVDESSAPLFAAEVLSRVHVKYEEEVLAMYGPDNDVPKLVLDDLKWLFDHKVRTTAETRSREIFVCSGCYEEGHIRWCAFEGLIQHYGAKHAPEFGKNNITVDWQNAEWPEEQPFVTDLTKIIKPKPVHRQDRARYNGRPASAQRQQMLSDNPLFAPKAGSPAPTPVQEEPPTNTAVANVAAVAEEVFKATDGVSKMPHSIRVWTVLQHVKTQFEQMYRRYIPMDLFIEALQHDKLAELKELDDVSCRFCQPRVHTMPAYQAKLDKKKRYTLGNLLNHFNIVHMTGNTMDPTSWMDFLDLPSKHDLDLLLKTPGMNDAKLALIAHAFPGIYRDPLPVIGDVGEDSSEKTHAARMVSKALGGNNSGKLTKKQKQKAAAAAAAAAAQKSQYDPSDPTIPGSRDLEDIDMSLFDSDLRKKPIEHVPTLIRPETLAAISSITDSLSSAQRAQLEAPPSPLANTRLLSLPKKGPSPEPVKSGPPPDIAAIIAALQANATQKAAPVSVAPRLPSPSQPPAAMSPGFLAYLQKRGHNTASKQQLSHSYTSQSYDSATSTPPAPAWLQSVQGHASAPPPPAGYYRPPTPPSAYPPAPTPSFNGQDLLVALTQNARSHEQAGSYANHGEYHPPTSLPPPQYGQPYAQQYPQPHPAPQYAPTHYMPPQPMPYAQTPAYEQASPALYGQPVYQAAQYPPQPPPPPFPYDGGRGPPPQDYRHATAAIPYPPAEPVRYDAYGRRI